VFLSELESAWNGLEHGVKWHVSSMLSRQCKVHFNRQNSFLSQASTSQMHCFLFLWYTAC
jgi:hypothetical protein